MSSYIDAIQRVSAEHVAKAQAELARYVVRVGNGHGLLKELKRWPSLYSPSMVCDVSSLIDAMPRQARLEYLIAVNEQCAQPKVTSVLQEMVDAGVRLQKGLYGADEPDTGTIRRGLAYMRHVFERQGGKPDARVKALEYMVVTRTTPLTLKVVGEQARVQPNVKFSKIGRFRGTEMSDPRSSFAEQLLAQLGPAREGR